jgi:hypothetical protein
MSADTIRRRFEQALISQDLRVALRDLAITLKKEGFGQAEIYRLFANYQNEVGGDDPRYDAIVDTMDDIAGGGWAKGVGLFEKELTDNDLKAP